MSNNNQLSIWWDESRLGNVKSFGQIHHALYPSLYRYIFKIIKDDDICQDLLQDLFVKLWEKKEAIGAISFVKVYFFRTARSLTINHLKCIRNQNVPFEEGMEADFVFSQEEIVVKDESHSELSKMLTIALNTLPKRQREMIFLKYFDGWDYDEIAAVTGINYQSVVNHVHRGIVHLRNRTADKNSLNFLLAV
ncbi:RNA polymerase sigma factor [Mucilaginibacter sp. ZT4R22]|uniref:RNA polymerase sigma factor n=1 Tax=Mucilaginibacter pankratovii TaxID=2772110 RepID=A0ABR7WK57_9SPHI|nr:RNA polymerase sigma factor [Mucilaginibacter pankratovii]MBD1362696.1 RNA polymerase sigma factor [Mucilaginibacter pankratovii]